MSLKNNIVLDNIFLKLGIFSYVLDYSNNKIIIFYGKFILDLSFFSKKKYDKKGKYCYYSFIESEDIYLIYRKNNFNLENKNFDIYLLIEKLLKLERNISVYFLSNLINFKKNIIGKIKNYEEVLFIDDLSEGLEEKIENGILNFLSKTDIKLTFLYKFGNKHIYPNYFDDLKENYKNVNFIRYEDLNDDYIDSITNNYTRIISLGYDYNGCRDNVYLIVLHKVSDKIQGKYKSIFSLYKSKNIGHSESKFIQKSKVYNFMNPQDILLINNINILQNVNNCILSGGNSRTRNFQLLGLLNKCNINGILITNGIFEFSNFLLLNGIKNYYGFLLVFKMSLFTIHTYNDYGNSDDRTRMISTSIAAGKPVIIPYNNGLIVREIINNNLGLVYEFGNDIDFVDKVNKLLSDKLMLTQLSNNCIKYSKKNLSVNDFIKNMFGKII